VNLSALAALRVLPEPPGAPLRTPSSLSFRFLQTCLIYVAFGLGVMPAIFTRRVFRCMTART